MSVQTEQTSGEVAPSRVQQTVAAITQHIRDHGLMPGDSLPGELSLARDFGVARSVVREALQCLAALGLVSQGAGRRSTVARIDGAAMALLIEHGVHTEQISIQQIYDVRRTIEARTVALAALRRSDDEAARITRHAAAMRAHAGAPGELMEHDLAFHGAIAAAARNPIFTLIVGAFQPTTRWSWPIGWRARTTAAARERMLATHAGIAEAVAAGDPTAATSLMGEHFDESVRVLLEAGLA